MWHYLFVKDTMKAAALSSKLPDDYFQFQLIHPNRNAAIFSRTDKETGGEHFYFSPGLELIASSNGASPCERPLANDRGGIIAGDETRISRFDG